MSTLSMEPHPQRRQQLVGIDWLRQIVGRPGLQALLAITFHRLRRQCYYRQTPQFWLCANHFDRLITVHLWHHDVHEHDRDTWLGFDHLERFVAGSGCENAHSPPLQYAAERENIARIVVYQQNGAPD